MGVRHVRTTNETPFVSALAAILILHDVKVVVHVRDTLLHPPEVSTLVVMGPRKTHVLYIHFEVFLSSISAQKNDIKFIVTMNTYTIGHHEHHQETHTQPMDDEGG
jgi:hypothetical protein